MTRTLGSHSSDIHPILAEVFMLPIVTRVPLKFGSETLTSVQCLRVRMTVADSHGKEGIGWGETPLSIQWAWPSSLSYEVRLQSMIAFSLRCRDAWSKFKSSGHPMEIGQDFITQCLPDLISEHSKNVDSDHEHIPYLAALICASAFDIALHDAYGKLHQVDIYQTYNKEWMNRDLSAYLSPASASTISFKDLYPADFFVAQSPKKLDVWHLVGGLDPLEESELKGDEPNDGVPLYLRQWIAVDGLRRLKIKLRGNDSDWDYDRMVRVGKIAIEQNVLSTTADFNCTVQDPSYVNDILDRLQTDHPTISKLLLYVEQPFPYDLDKYRIDVHSLSQRKPLFLDESAHDWQHVRLGRELGWTGVALKTCKTQTGALLSHCWARAHGMSIMVQDLTNPMLAQIPHVRLAAHVGTIGGVESNGMQFYPAASSAEAKVHPGIYQRRNGILDLSTISGPGFGYRIEEIQRDLPTPS